MRKFNPEKELNKIRKGNKNKLVIGIITLLLIIAVGSTYALYQIRHTQKLVFNTVGEFKKRDIILSVLVDGETKSEFPGKDDGYVFDNIQCDKPGIEASFNNETWKLTLTTGTTNKCTVKFITKPYMDDSGANYPDLFQGLIPIRYDQGKIYIADYQQKWYDYNNHEWANAVLIDHNNSDIMKKFYTDGELNVGTEITTDDILQMYVWIPRYKYELFNVDNRSVKEQMINVEFENTIETTGEVSCTYTNMKNGTIQENCINAENGKWYTHPAFTFGDTELRGIWVGKFEPSHTTKSLTSNETDTDAKLNCVDENCVESNYIRILPNKSSLRYNVVSEFFYVSRSIEKGDNIFNLNSNEIDTHMAKNIEWGAIVYLTQSKYGRYTSNEKGDATSELNNDTVWGNNNANFLTGCGESEFRAEATAECNAWTSELGKHASTTNNIFGIYDMVNGAEELVMGSLADANGEIQSQYQDFTHSSPLSTKYYDLYTRSENNLAHERGHLGDATRETLKKFSTHDGSWFDSQSGFPYYRAGTGQWAWFTRGGSSIINSIKSGIFAYDWTNGAWDRVATFRVVLTAQDGID